MRQLHVRPLLVLVCGFYQLSAQSSTTLHGRIVDPSQRPVPRATITALNKEKMFSREKITICLSIKKETVSVTVSDQATKLDSASDSHQDSLKLNANDLASLPIRDGDFLSALSFFTNPSGGESPTIIVDGMERTDSVTLSPSEVSEVSLEQQCLLGEVSQTGKGAD